jgi:hypothetical protein
MFGKRASGVLVPIHGTDPRRGPWEHRAFVPHPLPDESPDLSPRTSLLVADARAALGALDSTAGQLPNPSCFAGLHCAAKPRAPLPSRGRTPR